MSASNQLVLSHHAQFRARRRGVSAEDIKLILEHGEAVKDVGSGCLETSLRRSQMAALHTAGIAVGTLEKLARLLVIEASDGTIVTVIKNALYARRSRRSGQTCRERAISSMLHRRGRRA